MEENRYSFNKPENWATPISEEEILSLVKETDFAKKQLDDNKDHCYFLKKVINTQDAKNQEYLSMAYTLNQQDTLEGASVFEKEIGENQQLDIHRFAVIREGVLIDKLQDAKIKLIDDENASARGIYNKDKKINIVLKDIRKYDIIVIEYTQTTVLTEKDFLKKEFYKYIFSTPDNYWSYSIYDFQLINNRSKAIDYKNCYFRDDAGNVIQAEVKTLTTGEVFRYYKTDYINEIDTARQIYPYIDFATQATWESLTDYIFPFYNDIRESYDLATYAPDLKEKIDAIPDQEHKIRFVIEYVQNSIRYIYDAEDMNGHLPQNPALTYELKQGDCKAKSILLQSLLDDIGVDSEIILVNYRSDFHIKSYLPSLLSFNHAIVKIHYQGKEYLVDATSTEEYGLLEHRRRIQVYHYLPIKKGEKLRIFSPFYYEQDVINEKIDYQVEKDKGNIRILSTFRYQRADNIRRMFKNKSNREILDTWLDSIFYTLNFNNDRKEEDIRNVFVNAHIKLVSDDEDKNEVVVDFVSDLEQPYFTNKDGKRFLMYWDFTTLKSDVRKFVHNDFTLWHGYDRESYEINMKTDLKIDTKEKYTIQECNIQNPYFTHTLKKKIHANGGTAIINYNPLTNLDIPFEDIPKLKEDYLQVEDSNFGLGIDIIEQEKNLMNKIKNIFGLN